MVAAWRVRQGQNSAYRPTPLLCVGRWEWGRAGTGAASAWTLLDGRYGSWLRLPSRQIGANEGVISAMRLLLGLAGFFTGVAGVVWCIALGVAFVTGAPGAIRWALYGSPVIVALLLGSFLLLRLATRPRTPGLQYVEQRRQRSSILIVFVLIVGFSVSLCVVVALSLMLGAPDWVVVLVLLGGTGVPGVLAAAVIREPHIDPYRCPQCGYDLRGAPLVTKRRVCCSECGRVVRLDESDATESGDE